VLDNVDANSKRGIPRRHASNAEQDRKLAESDRKSRTRDEGRNGAQRNEIDEPAEPEQTDPAEEGAGEDGDDGGDDLLVRVWVLGYHIANDAARDERRNGDGADADVLGRAEDPVAEGAEE
jgi:hypothetical protein